MKDIGIFTYATFLLDQNKCKLVQNSIGLQIFIHEQMNTIHPYIKNQIKVSFRIMTKSR